MKMKALFLAVLLSAISSSVAAISSSVAVATDPTPLPPPTDRVLLEVDGAIAVSNRDGTARFDATMLENLGTVEFTTSTPWTDGKAVFKGVPLQAVLDRVGAEGDVLKVTALNDYSAEVPAEDGKKFGALLAMSVDGKRLSIRDKGPLWIVYPRDGNPELSDVKYNDRWVWQIARITVK